MRKELDSPQIESNKPNCNSVKEERPKCKKKKIGTHVEKCPCHLSKKREKTNYIYIYIFTK